MESKEKAVYAILHEESAKLKMSWLRVWESKDDQRTIPTYNLAIEDLEKARKIYEEIGYKEAEQEIRGKINKVRKKLEEITTN